MFSLVGFFWFCSIWVLTLFGSDIRIQGGHSLLIFYPTCQSCLEIPFQTHPYMCLVNWGNYQYDQVQSRLIIIGFLYFHMNFKTVFSASVKNAFGILMGMALNLQSDVLFIILYYLCSWTWEVFLTYRVFFNLSQWSFVIFIAHP
jgi:hypothetical protein